MESGKCANQALRCQKVVFADPVEQVKAVEEAQRSGIKLPTSTEMCIESCDKEIKMLGYKLICVLKADKSTETELRTGKGNEASTNFLFF